MEQFWRIGIWINLSNINQVKEEGGKAIRARRASDPQITSLNGFAAERSPDPELILGQLRKGIPRTGRVELRERETWICFKVRLRLG